MMFVLWFIHGTGEGCRLKNDFFKLMTGVIPPYWLNRLQVLMLMDLLGDREDRKIISSMNFKWNFQLMRQIYIKQRWWRYVYYVLLGIRFFVIRKIYNVRCVCYMLRIFCQENNTVHYSSFYTINDCLHGGRGVEILLCRPKIDV